MPLFPDICLFTPLPFQILLGPSILYHSIFQSLSGLVTLKTRQHLNMQTLLMLSPLQYANQSWVHLLNAPSWIKMFTMLWFSLQVSNVSQEIYSFDVRWVSLEMEQPVCNSPSCLSIWSLIMSCRPDNEVHLLVVTDATASPYSLREEFVEAFASKSDLGVNLASVDVVMHC